MLRSIHIRATTLTDDTSKVKKHIIEGALSPKSTTPTKGKPWQVH